MITCKTCGGEVTLQAGQGWQHTDPSDHEAVPSSKLVHREPPPQLLELERRVDTLKATHPSIENIEPYPLRHELIQQFTDCFNAHYYQLSGVPWQTVKAHDTTLGLCHCRECTSRCQVCLARS